MTQKKLEIFDDKLSKYQERPVRGIYIDTHNEFVKVSPADYTGLGVGPRNVEIQKRDVYDAIVAAEAEAKELRITKNFLPLGVDTHSIKLNPSKLGLATTYKIDLVLNLDNPKVELKAFKALVEKYGVYYFPLGRVPFHNNQVSNAMTQLAKSYKHARISSVFYRKRDMHPRVYVGIAMNDFVFNVRSTTHIDIDDFGDESETPVIKTSRIELDL
jgi:hypothetical protein